MDTCWPHHCPYSLNSIRTRRSSKPLHSDCNTGQWTWINVGYIAAPTIQTGYTPSQWRRQTYRPITRYAGDRGRETSKRDTDWFLVPVVSPDGLDQPHFIAVSQRLHRVLDVQLFKLGQVAWHAQHLPANTIHLVSKPIQKQHTETWRKLSRQRHREGNIRKHCESSADRNTEMATYRNNEKAQQTETQRRQHTETLRKLSRQKYRDGNIQKHEINSAKLRKMQTKHRAKNIHREKHWDWERELDTDRQAERDRERQRGRQTDRQRQTQRENRDGNRQHSK